MTVNLFGIKACDTCRKAAKELSASGIDVIFRDIRDQPLSAENILRFCQAFGEAAINRRSTTWRELDETARLEAPESLLAQYPTLLKRPVLEGPGGLTIGWDAAVRAAHLAG